MNEDKIQSMLFPPVKTHQKKSTAWMTSAQSNAHGYVSPSEFISPISNMAKLNGNFPYQSCIDSESNTGSTYASNIAASGRKGPE